MSIEENKQLAATFLRLFSEGPADEALALTTEDFRYWVTGDLPMSGTHDKATVAQLLQGMAGAFKEPLRLEILDYTAEGDRVAVEARSTAKTLSGKSFNNVYHFLFKMRDGKIERLHEYMDTKHVAEVFG
ncbi:MAG: hypothetical protein JWL96_2805 [Sphingomonas bacterium]|uniref:nuclear transport factor 2 family protein n=1 Tax=Sphingomonas bacterium TaxID=1895847 RepID=UPI002632A142|nr:nuclear transport factor 2 family protein [Sphingomonas bacterium]MDB5710735.1 hypothetical protein [Sphingomonas bacterium]